MAGNDKDDLHTNPEPHVTFCDIQRPYITFHPLCIQLSRGARNYEFKNIHLNALTTFNGHQTEDALDFLREYYAVIDTLPLNGISEEELKLCCVPYCLKGEARQWVLRLPEASIKSWAEMYEQFILKYYSSQKTSKLRDKNHFFTQQDESFHEAWERYNLLISQCPHHQFPHILLMKFFYNELDPENHCEVDNAASPCGS
ncbi:hypothetical protein QN277_028722 [Acacia crassicarpa]|uniref:Retrotransposon gag domain-containing protein n=1 Tax=Acacia crassicarpa TaxID=499986 RepID=A0AAE1J3U4_9FABA|nr:hypothetical protein QN277_028722 [Acacia crassicarpa]